MNDYRDHIYIATVLLEKNRWLDGERRPSLLVSDWLSRFQDAGFDGIELWQNHALLASPDEIDALRRSPVPVRILNSYAGCEDQSDDERGRSAEAARLLLADGMKFNFGREPTRHEEYVRNVQAWRRQLPADFRFLCECHGGTTMEDPKRASETFNRLGCDDYEIIDRKSVV